MKYLAGAGKDYISMASELSDWEYILLDSDSTKIGSEVLGNKVVGYDILKDTTKTDKVFVTSRKYYSEICSEVRRYSSDIPIALLPEYLWSQKVTKIPDILKSINKYNVVMPINEWINSAVEDEVCYWRKSIVESKEKNDYRLYERNFEYYWDSELQFKKDDLIIDIGCGPLPKFGNKLSDGIINYQPVDPMAHQYIRLLNENEIQLPVTPKFGMAELLSLFYKENCADYVIIHNALDHTYDIMRALIEMLRVCKVEGYVLMNHMDSEGIFENYSGMHQWNITEHYGDLYFFNKKVGINVTKTLFGFADVNIKRNTIDYRDEIIVRIKKKKNIPINIIKQYDEEFIAGSLISALFKRII